MTETIQTKIAFTGTSGGRKFSGTLDFDGEPPFKIDLQPEQISLSLTMMGKAKGVRLLLEIT